MEKRQNSENLNSALKMRALSMTFRWTYVSPCFSQNALEVKQHITQNAI